MDKSTFRFDLLKKMLELVLLLLQIAREIARMLHK